MSKLLLDDFKPWLQKAISESGGVSACAIPLDHPDFRQAVTDNAIEYQQWLNQGFAGDMHYLERFADKKATPWDLFPEMKSIITFTFSNDWGSPEAQHPFPTPRPDKLVGYISAYAKEQDYHRTGHQIMLKLQEKLNVLLGRELNVEYAVDTKPIFERLFASFGGLGIKAPNDLIRTPERDVRVFIGTLFIDDELPLVQHQAKMRFPCEFCRNCEEKCPTGAITPGQPFNSLKCSSYLSIEKKGPLNKQQRIDLEDWLFGCDWCTVVCPPKDKIDTRIPIELDWLLKSSGGEVKRLLKGTSIEYAGVPQLRRNAIAILQEKYPDHPEAKELIEWTAENSKAKVIQDQINNL